MTAHETTDETVPTCLAVTPHDLAADIARRIEALATRAGLDIPTLALRSGVPAPLLVRAVAGETVLATTHIVRLAKTFGVPAGALLDGNRRQTHLPETCVLAATAAFTQHFPYAEGCESTRTADVDVDECVEDILAVGLAPLLAELTSMEDVLSRQAGEWRQEADAWRDTVTAIDTLHRPFEHARGSMCAGCGNPFPCLTSQTVDRWR